MDLTINELQSAVKGTAAAFRCVTRLQPSGGPGDKVFPPTYSGGQYATEKRRLPNEPAPVDCVLLDSVQSQANRMELALLASWEDQRLKLPVVSVDFKDQGLPKLLCVTSLDAPHRIVDALLRDSLLDGVPFRKSTRGQALDHVDNRNATALFQLCPTALLFGLWDSTGPRGGLGAKFARALVSEVVGIDAVAGVKTSSRIDPAEILKSAGPIFRTPSGDWTLDPSLAIDKDGKKVLYKQSKGKDVFYDEKKDAGKVPDQGRPSVINHGNVTPDVVYRRDQNGNPIRVETFRESADGRLVRDKEGQPVPIGGFTIRYAQQIITLSLPALRRLRFPVDAAITPERDVAARVVLVALGLCAATLARESGCDLRSRCHLIPESTGEWELLDRPNEQAKTFVLDSERAISLLNEASAAAKAVGLQWLDEELKLTPSPQLVALVKKSQQLAASVSESDGDQ